MMSSQLNGAGSSKDVALIRAAKSPVQGNDRALKQHDCIQNREGRCLKIDRHRARAVVEQKASGRELLRRHALERYLLAEKRGRIGENSADGRASLEARLGGEAQGVARNRRFGSR